VSEPVEPEVAEQLDEMRAQQDDEEQLPDALMHWWSNSTRQLCMSLDIHSR
jgi:hypothetical protein